MKIVSFLNILFILVSIAGMTQTDDDLYLAANLKKQFPDERFGASELLEEYRFDPGVGLDNAPVVSVTGKTSATFVALRDGASFPYYQYYNKFVALKNFDYYYRNRKEKFVRASIKAVDKPMTEDGIFLDDNRIKYYPVYLREFGEAARFEFTEQYSDSKYFTRLFFHQPYAIKDHKIRLVIPSWLELDIKEMNFAGYKINRAKTTENGNEVITFTLQNAEPVLSEPHSAGWAYQWPHLLITVKAWTAAGLKHNGFGKIDDLYVWYHTLYKKCENKPADLKETVEKIIAGKTTPEAKAKAIYYWVQDNIRYIAFEDGYAGFIPTPAQDVLKNKYGDCKGMANLMTEMLKLAGLDAHYALVGTRQIPYDHHSVYAMCVDNHAITCLYIQGKPLLLDATEKYGSYGEVAYRISGKTALVEKGEAFEVVDIPVLVPEQNKTRTQATFSIKDNNHLAGKITYTLTGEMRTQFLQLWHTIPSNRREEFLKDYMSFGNGNMEVKTAALQNNGEREKPVIITADVDFNNQLTRIDGEWFAGIDFFPAWLKSYTPGKKRKRSIDLDMNGMYEDEITLTLPAGYIFRDLPAPVNVETAGYTYSGAYTVDKQKVTLKKSLSIRQPIIHAAQFEQWSAFLADLKKFNSNLISATAP
ncbi:MAG: transglutaminase-like domain-containing protein [Chitinophagaceae bacterium]|nr:transglutaminase-like domain-containing protein [Chitinophagaceae bacterium]